VATSLGVDMRGSANADGELDSRGTLAIDKDVPAECSAIRVQCCDLQVCPPERVWW
jgi:hypothetical protein